MQDLETIIEDAFETRSQGFDNRDDVKRAVEEAITLLDSGKLRVAEKRGSDWHVNQWLKKAVLLSWFAADGVRVVPDAIVRRGAYVAPDVVLMPCFTNIGAFIDSGTMVDTWATVGSCAQIGKNVHLSGGVGIGGVLEPVQAGPTIIEDDCFIGARSEVVEGVIVEKGSVISMGVYLGQSTRIYNRETEEISYGRIPAGSVVVSGNLPSPDKKYSLYCAVIVKQVDAKTRAKTGLNELLRNLD